MNGRVILPEGNNYDEARKIYHAMINKKPDAILKCMDADDVVTAVNFAMENKLEVSIKSGGHNGAGFALVNDRLVIDLSVMSDINN